MALEVFKLSHPIEIKVKSTDGERVDLIEELPFVREPNAGDFWDMGLDITKVSNGDFLKVFAACVGKPESVIRKMHPVDMLPAVGIITSFYV